jgi:hypothetical protein
MGAALFALLAIATILAVWELRRPLRLLRTRLLPKLHAARLRRIAEGFGACGTSRDLADGKLVRVVGTVVAPDGARAPGDVALSQLLVWGEFGEPLEERTDCADFSLRLGDGEVVKVGTLEAAKTNRLQLLEGKAEERYGAGHSCRRQILIGDVVAVSGQVRQVIDEKAISPHPRITPVSWRLRAADGCPLIVEAAERTARRLRITERREQGRILAVPISFISMLLLGMSAETAMGAPGAFPVFGCAGLSGIMLAIYVAIVGAPGIFRSWSRWLLATGFLAASIFGFWFGVLLN